MIIDAHTHIGNLPNSPYAETTFEQNLNSLLKEMKDNKVNHAFILAYFEDDKDDPGTKTVLKLTKGMKNVSVLGTIDLLNYQKKDLDELEELLREKEIIGVKLYLGYQHIYPYDGRCKPIYELCRKYDVPVVFHTGDTLSYSTKAKVKYAHPLHIDDVATDFSDLKIVIAHLGNPWIMDCAEVLYKNENVYADLSGLTVQGLDEGLDSPCGEMIKKKIQELMLYSSPRKLLYGTDWPLAPIESYIKFVKKLDVSKEDLDYIFYKNAARLFKIKI